MKNNKQDNSKVLSILPKIARKFGENSVDATCHWWVNQPKVPEGLKSNKK